MVIQAIQAVLSLLILIVLGYIVAGKPWFGTQGTALFSKFTVTIAIPCYMFYNVMTTCEDSASLLALFRGMPIPFLSIGISFALGLGLSRLCKIPTSQRGVFINAITFSNTVIIGFPVVEALFGSDALPDAMIYYMANTVLFWTIGVFYLRRDTDHTVSLFSLKGLRQILSPPMIGFILGILTVLLNITLPYCISSPLSMLKQLTTPMAMIFIGGVVRNSGLGSLCPTKAMFTVVVMRFVITPVLILGICALMPIGIVTKHVFFILATMPAMTQLGIMSKESGGDYTFASALIVVTTAISLVCIPLYTMLF